MPDATTLEDPSQLAPVSSGINPTPPTIPGDLPIPLSAALDRRGLGGSRTEDSEDSDGESDKTRAAAIIESIGREFVALRQTGRSPAWADLEDKLMTSAHILIGAGMMSAKDWIGIARDIEDFRKQEQGTQMLPADYLAKWLSEAVEPAPNAAQPKRRAAPPRSTHAPKRDPKSKTGKKATKVTV